MARLDICTPSCCPKSPRLVLASGSPRRAELLSQIGVTFQACRSDVQESGHSGNAVEVTQKLALLKAKAIANHYPEAIVIGADTLVSLNGTLLGKPADEADARAMLTLLQGTSHEVVTGIALVHAKPARDIVWVERTTIYFRELKRAEINTYIASGEALDKAGAYGIQGRAAAFVKRIEGCYFNVVGLPLASLVEQLRKFQAYEEV